MGSRFKLIEAIKKTENTDDIKDLSVCKNLSSASTLSITSSTFDDNNSLMSDSSISSTPKRKRSPIKEPPAKKYHGASAINLDIKMLLCGSASGASIICFYNENKNLDRGCRKKLVDIIIDHAMHQSSNLKEADFHFLAQKIVEFFKGETLSYYFIPCGESTGRQASGSLVIKYKSNRNKYIQMGVLSKSTEAKTIGTSNEEVEISDDLEDRLSWLKLNGEPWSKVTQLWAETCMIRNSIYLQEIDAGDKTASFHDLSKEYPALQKPKGHQLIEIDFKYKYPHSDNLLKSWDQIVLTILKFMEERFKKNDEIKLMLQSIVNPDMRDFIVWKLMHKLLPPTVTSSGKKESQKRWHPTVIDSQDAFVYHITDQSNIQAVIDEKKNLMLSKNMTLQPFCFAIGESVNDIKFYIVYIDGIMYRFDRLITAIDFLFKAFMVLNLEYPKQCFLVWLFVQQGIYKIYTNYDNQNLKVTKKSSVSGLISELKL